MWNRLPLLRWTTAVCLFITLLPLLGLAELEVKNRYLRGRMILPPESYDLPPAAVLRALAFGYNEVLADLLWLRSIAYYADHLTSDNDLRFLDRHLRNIEALDRHSKHIYRFGASMLVTHTRRTNRDVLAAIRLMKQGARLYPDDWRLPLYIGAYYIGELRTRDKKQRARWRLEGAQWITRASLVGADAPWLPALAAQIYSEQGRRDLAIRHLQELYHTAQSEEMKLQIAGKLKHLRATKIAVDLRQTTETLRRLREESETPYVSSDLFLFVGLPPLPPFSLEKVTAARVPPLLR